MRSITSSRGLSLTEVLVTTAVLSLVMAGVASGVLALQKSFFATRDFSEGQTEMVRVSDYLQRDGRSATSVSVGDDGKTVTMEIPTDSTGLVGLNLPDSLNSLLGGGQVPATKSVKYRFSGNEVSRTDDTSRRVIASKLSRFNATQDGAGLRLDLAFLSTYGDRTGREVESSQLTTNISLRTTGN